MPLTAAASNDHDHDEDHRWPRRRHRTRRPRAGPKTISRRIESHLGWDASSQQAVATDDPYPARHPVVALVTSAGGLEALPRTGDVLTVGTVLIGLTRSTPAGAPPRSSRTHQIR